MRTSATLFPLFFLFAFAATAQTYQLTVQNGYGSGQFAVGDTVHIWSEEWPFSKTFSHWSGQIASLVMPDEWHTRLIMPAHDVTVVANTKNLLPGANFTETQVMGRDTIQQVFYYFPPGGTPKGVVWLFHGTGGSAEGWVNTNIEQRLFANYLMADTLAVISIECEERTRNTDFSGDGNIRWAYNFDTVTNVDIANIRAIRDTFINRGWMTWATPQMAAGFSAGGSFSVLVASILNWNVAINHNTPGVQYVIDQTSTPILFSMTIRDQHPDVGPEGNQLAYDNYQYLIDKGNCTQFYMLLPSPVYPQRFLRIPGITTVESLGIFDELQNNGCLNAEHFLIKNSGEITALVVANPQNWPTLLSLTAQQRSFVVDEIEVMWAAHHFNTDFSAKDLRFIRQACGVFVSTSELQKAEKVSLFPNPASQVVALPAHCDRVKVYDLEGKLMLDNIVAGSAELNVSMLPSGLYFVEMRAHDRLQLAKLIKL